MLRFFYFIFVQKYFEADCGKQIIYNNPFLNKMPVNSIPFFKCRILFEHLVTYLLNGCPLIVNGIKIENKDVI
ncbi:hypothetical protein CHR53_17150 [Neobacillus mesonae]|uniref:Uncharacterized protein n=1 Tax=Neobacillus mesonae TaxID=1193713 RepID=A0A3Q9R048_9BACI|nr:hypothetical protein CHR53_17150 [Neobacillus mesonae]